MDLGLQSVGGVGRKVCGRMMAPEAFHRMFSIQKLQSFVG